MCIRDRYYLEYLGWCNYFNLYPIGWREDLRTRILLSAHVQKVPEDLFPSLLHMKNAKNDSDDIGFKGSVWEEELKEELGDDFYES